MSRLNATLSAEVAKRVVRVADIVEIPFPSGTLRLTNAARTLTVDSNAYLPDGRFVSISGVRESIDRQPTPVSIQCSGVDDAILNAVMNDKYHTLQVKPRMVFLDKDWNVIGDHLWGKFYMSTAVIRALRATAEVDITLIHKMIDFRRVHSVMATNADHQQRSPGDTFWKYVTAIIGYGFEWGGQSYIFGPGHPIPGISGLHGGVDDIMDAFNPANQAAQARLPHNMRF